MECPHLTNHRIVQQLPRKFSLACLGCAAENSLWFCVFCGHVGCSRYLKGHSLAHFEKMSSHSISMEIETTAVFCYMCDEYVVNNDEALEALRIQLNSFKASLTPSSSPKENGAAPAKIAKAANGTSLTSRPSRQLSSNANKLPGLKNLGNTCFMNAVVQCLGSIDHFTNYVTKLPTMDAKNFVFRRRNQPVSGQSLSPTAPSSGVNGGADGRLPLILDTPYTPLSQPETRLRRKRDQSRLNPSDPNNPNAQEQDSLVVEELRKVLLSLCDKNLRTISPDALFSAIWRVVPSFRGHQQQDAHEFMRFLLDRLHTELAHLQPSTRSKLYVSVSSAFPSDFGSLSPNDSSMFGRLTIVAAVFGGLLQSDVACHVCNNVSVKRDPFLDLSLDIPIPKDQLLAANSYTCRLVDCFTSFTELEELSESEHFYCPMCRKRQPSTKKFTIKRLPNVLCVHLKRFWWNGTNRIKLDTFVDFPLRCLDMSKYVLAEQRHTRLSAANSDSHYDLAAVIVHHGSGTGSGHFTTYAMSNGEWFHFNDSTVRPASLEDVQSAKAYILFYVRQNIRIPAALLAGCTFSHSCDASPNENGHRHTSAKGATAPRSRRSQGASTPNGPASMTNGHHSPPDSAASSSNNSTAGGAASSTKATTKHRHSL